jgi:hypothetical protein
LTVYCTKHVAPEVDVGFWLDDVVVDPVSLAVLDVVVVSVWLTVVDVDVAEDLTQSVSPTRILQSESSWGLRDLRSS